MKMKRIASTVLALLLLVLVIPTGGIIKAEEVIGTTSKSATEAVKEMGMGWNLGNAMDSYTMNFDAYDKAIQRRGNYQMMATYSTKYYSGWDCSSYPYFSSTTSICNLTWKVTKLNSSLSQAPGSLGVQIINNSLKNSGTDVLDYTVTTATFTTAAGEVINLTDLIGTFKKPVVNNVTAYVRADLTKYPQLKNSASLIGGTFAISVKINKYPMPLVPYITKEAFIESLSGNPATTKAMIDKVKEAGFKSIRIPVTYLNHLNNDGDIDEAWLKRVAQVVDYAIANDLYCIIDMHHDTGNNGWLMASAASEYPLEHVKMVYSNVWKEIANYFKNYDGRLVFEGYNEILNEVYKWNNAGLPSYKVANDLNQIFVDAVRSTGGNNSTRNLLLNTYAASAEYDVVKNFVLPKDTVANHLIVGAHYYGTSQTSVSTVLKRLDTHFVQKGIPVIIGEFGSKFSVAEADRITSATNYVKTAKQYNIACFWWDDGNYKNVAGAKCNFALLDRVSLKWYYPAIATALVNAVK